MAKSERQRDNLRRAKFVKTFRHTLSRLVGREPTPAQNRKDIEQVARAVDIEFRALAEYINNILPFLLFAPRPGDKGGGGTPPPSGGPGWTGSGSQVDYTIIFPKGPSAPVRAPIGAPLTLIGNNLAIDPADTSGLQVVDSKLVYTPLISSVKTSAYTAQENEVVMVDPSGGAFTITLPSASTLARSAQVVIKNTTSSTNVITVAAAGSDLIDGAASVTLDKSFGSLILIASGGSWSLTGQANTGLPNISNTTPTEGDILVFNGTKWIPYPDGVLNAYLTANYTVTNSYAAVGWTAEGSVGNHISLSPSTEVKFPAGGRVLFMIDILAQYISGIGSLVEVQIEKNGGTGWLTLANSYSAVTIPNSAGAANSLSIHKSISFNNTDRYRVVVKKQGGNVRILSVGCRLVVRLISDK